MARRRGPVDRSDGYAPAAKGPGAALVLKDGIDGYRPDMMDAKVQDAYVNQLTGFGDPNRDKTMGGRHNGPPVIPRFFTGWECMNRWRSSDLGTAIVEKIPHEMTREWIDIAIQPDTPASEKLSPEKYALKNLDAFPAPSGGEASAPDPFGSPQPKPQHVPGKLPDIDDASARVVEALRYEQETLSAKHVFRQALNYERAYGGGAVLIGVDDGVKDLTIPLDLNNIDRVTHLTAFTGGWDGEVIAWRYYNDPRHAKFGKPEVYQLRNIGVPIAAPPAPGETTKVPQTPPAGPTGGMTFYVHESRMLIFGGSPVSRWAMAQMRGWADSIFTRADEVLSQYSQTWNGVAILMQEWSQGVLSIEGLAQLLADGSAKKQGIVMQRALMLQLTQSVARMRLIDAKEKYQREQASMGGVADVLREFALRLAAAVGMPVSMLFGQVKGGLGDAGNTDMRFFYDQVKALQLEGVIPAARRLTQIQFYAKETSPTGGKEPKRWDVTPRALYQLNEQEEADLRNKQATTDGIYLQWGVMSAEECAASRFGGSRYSTETTLDLAGRQQMGKMSLPPSPAEIASAKKPPGSGGGGAGSNPNAPNAGSAPYAPKESPGSSPPARLSQNGGPGMPDKSQKPATMLAVLKPPAKTDDVQTDVLRAANERITNAALYDGHGHVIARVDGMRARCGGRGLCARCRQDAEAVEIVRAYNDFEPAAPPPEEQKK